MERAARAGTYAEFAQLLETLKATKLPFTSLALMPAWRGDGRPELLELIPNEAGMIVDPLPKG